MACSHYVDEDGALCRREWFHTLRDGGYWYWRWVPMRQGSVLARVHSRATGWAAWRFVTVWR